MKKKKEKIDHKRRSMIKTAGIGAAGFMIVPRHVLGGKGYVAPSDMLNIAVIDITKSYNTSVWANDKTG